MSTRSPVRSFARSLREVSRRTGRGFRAAVVTGRWFVLAAWLVAAVAAVVLPASAGGGGGSGDFGELLPADSEAAAVQQRSAEEFLVPVLSDTAVVVHDPGGLSALTRADIALWAAMHTEAFLRGDDAPADDERIIAAVPIPTSSPNTAVTYLYVSSAANLTETTALAQQYAAHFRNQASVDTYVTGITPAQVQQGYHLLSRLHLFEVTTLVLIALVVALAFRSLVAPLVVLLAAGIGYLVAVRVLSAAAAALGFALPDLLRPLTAALLIGVVTDYCVLFFSGFRNALLQGQSRLAAARTAVTREAPIVAVAGITVAAGTAALLAADFELFRAFGPALSLTIVVGLLVSLTLVPALIAVLGSWLFFPVRPDESAGRVDRSAGRGARWMARTTSTTRGAAAAVVLAFAVLVPAALPLSGLRLDLSFSAGLPADDPVSRGSQVLEASGVRGVVAPTEILVEGEDITDRRAELERFQAAVAAQPGVAEVLGPAQNPLPDDYGVVFSRDGDTARLIVVLDSDPLGAAAIDDVGRLQDRLPELLDQAGLGDASVGVAGQTAVAAELAEVTKQNLWRTVVAVLFVEFVILALYLRALVTPVLLLLSSAVGVAAALGLSVVVFQGLLGDPGLTFYVPFTTAVLLLALGSDYNVFAVGSVWEEASRRPLRHAIAVAMPATARAISAAGVILAATFAMVGIIPLDEFRQVAFVMSVGLLIDTFLIRPVLTPAMLTLLGPMAVWPSRRIRTSGGSLDAREQSRLLHLREDEPPGVEPAEDRVPTGVGS